MLFYEIFVLMYPIFLQMIFQNQNLIPNKIKIISIKWTLIITKSQSFTFPFTIIYQKENDFTSWYSGIIFQKHSVINKYIENVVIKFSVQNTWSWFFDNTVFIWLIVSIKDYYFNTFLKKFEDNLSLRLYYCFSSHSLLYKSSTIKNETSISIIWSYNDFSFSCATYSKLLLWIIRINFVIHLLLLYL